MCLTGRFNDNISLVASEQKFGGVRSLECWQVFLQAVFALVHVNRSLGGGTKHYAYVFSSLFAISWEGSTDVLQITPIKYRVAKFLGWL